MRSPIRAPAALTLAFVTSLAACFACAGDKRTPSPTAGKSGAESSASVEVDGRALAEARVGDAVAPRLGGSVAFVDDYQVEVAVHDDGAVQGLVFDGEGNALAHGGVTDFKLTLRGAGGAKPEAGLDWDEGCACYRGQASVTTALIAEPIDVSFGSLGRTHTGLLSGYKLLTDSAARKASSQLAGATKHKDLSAPNAKASFNARASTKAAPKARTKAAAKAQASLKASAPKTTAKHTQKTASPSTGSGSVKARAGVSFGTN
jgi:hypothetical protein